LDRKLNLKLTAMNLYNKSSNRRRTLSKIMNKNAANANKKTKRAYWPVNNKNYPIFIKNTLTIY
jgi:hypothetical protein